MMFELVYFFQKEEQRSHVELKDELKRKEAFTQRLNSSKEFNCSDIDLCLCEV